MLFQIAINLIVLSCYEFLDFFARLLKISEKKQKAFLLFFAMIFSLFFLIFGSYVSEEDFSSKVMMSFAGNLIGYGEILIYLVKFKQILNNLGQAKT